MRIRRPVESELDAALDQGWDLLDSPYTWYSAHRAASAKHPSPRIFFAAAEYSRTSSIVTAPPVQAQAADEPSARQRRSCLRYESSALAALPLTSTRPTYWTTLSTL